MAGLRAARAAPNAVGVTGDPVLVILAAVVVGVALMMISSVGRKVVVNASFASAGAARSAASAWSTSLMVRPKRGEESKKALKGCAVVVLVAEDVGAGVCVAVIFMILRHCSKVFLGAETNLGVLKTETCL